MEYDMEQEIDNETAADMELADWLKKYFYELYIKDNGKVTKGIDTNGKE